MKRLLLAIGLAAALTGCTQKPATPPPAPAAEPAATTPATPAAAEAQPAPAPATEAPTAATPAPITARPLAGNWTAGKNYVLLAPAQPTNVDPGQVEILEFMWLGCPHCYALNPYIEAWKKKLPAYVAFRQVHVTWDSLRMPHARLFYTLEALGRSDLLVKAFDEIHGKNEAWMSGSDSTALQTQLAFAAANGIDVNAYEREYKGFAVSTSLKRADDLVRRYRIDTVPTLIVNGKYRTDEGMAGGPEKLTQLLTDLAASEKAH
jgi:thiol:disulfide interchange protein DsbA